MSPTYSYLCEKCKHEFETYHTPSVRLVKCPMCEKPKLIRLVGTGNSVRFKCKGFYTTDVQKRWHIM
jgi:putative FmdB family regulatory protein